MHGYSSLTRHAGHSPSATSKAPILDLMIVVTGSTGRVGGLVAQRLAQEGHLMRLLGRDPPRAPPLQGVEVEVADYGNPPPLAKGLQDGERGFMVSLWIGRGTRLDLHRSLIHPAAK